MSLKGAPGDISFEFLWARILIVVAFGVTYVFLIPPLEAPDEPAHFARAYGVAEGQFILRDHPRDLVEYFCRTLETRKREDILLSLATQALKEHSNRIPNLALNTSLYSPVSYFFHAGAIRFAKLFGYSIPTTLYLCRITSLLLFVFSLYMSFRFFPEGSWPIFWIAATPMALSQASIVSPDVIVLGSAVVLLSVCLGVAKNGRYFWALVLSLFFLLQTKPPYAPLFLVPVTAYICTSGRERFLRLKSVITAGLIGFLGTLVWQYIARSENLLNKLQEMYLEVGGVDIDPASQLLGIVLHFGVFLSAVWNTLEANCSALFHQFVGVLGWLDIPIPFWSAVLWGLFSLPAVFVLGGGYNIKNFERPLVLGLSCLVAALATAISIFASAYVIWMPIGAESVNVQGRYFHPVAAAVFFGTALISPWRVNSERLCIFLGYSLLIVAVIINSLALHTIANKF